MSPRASDWQADFAVLDPNGRSMVIAEAKRKSAADPQWAGEWFRNYMAHQQSAAPLFVLLATPETLYIWKRTENFKFTEPTARVDARRLFAPYLRNSSLEVSTISGPTFEFIVGVWLDDLSHGLWTPSEPEERRAIADSGLLDAVANGRVVAGIAA